METAKIKTMKYQKNSKKKKFNIRIIVKKTKKIYESENNSQQKTNDNNKGDTTIVWDVRFVMRLPQKRTVKPYLTRGI